MKVSLLIFILLLTFNIHTEGKMFKRCELARALAHEDISRSLISNYVCLAEAVSGSDTKKMTQKSPTINEYGIFQINSKYWCGKNGKDGGKCKISCEKFLDDDIRDDIQCAKKIQEQMGFKDWIRWNVRCKSDAGDPNKYLPNLVNCLYKK